MHEYGVWIPPSVKTELWIYLKNFVQGLEIYTSSKFGGPLFVNNHRCECAACRSLFNEIFAKAVLYPVSKKLLSLLIKSNHSGLRNYRILFDFNPELDMVKLSRLAFTVEDIEPFG